MLKQACVRYISPRFTNKGAFIWGGGCFLVFWIVSEDSTFDLNIKDFMSRNGELETIFIWDYDIRITDLSIQRFFNLWKATMLESHLIVSVDEIGKFQQGLH